MTAAGREAESKRESDARSSDATHLREKHKHTIKSRHISTISASFLFLYCFSLCVFACPFSLSLALSFALLARTLKQQEHSRVYGACGHQYRQNHAYSCRAAQHGVCAIRFGSAPTRYTWRSAEKIADFLPEIIYNCLFIYTPRHTRTHTVYTYTDTRYIRALLLTLLGPQESKTQRAHHAWPRTLAIFLFKINLNK